MSQALTRRSFLAAGAGLLSGGLLGVLRLRPPAGAGPNNVTGRIVGPNIGLGHRLRGGDFPIPASEEKTGIAIVGGGMAGLSAGWKLARSGFEDFRLLELEQDLGGNSRWGENAVSAYPWGAHYLPLPTPESKAVSELLRELRVETGRDARGEPVYDPRCLRFAPAERLYIHGRWRKDLFPRDAASKEELGHYDAFEREMSRYRSLRGSDGCKAFAIPMELSSRDPELLALDRISMARFLADRGWDSARLRWYVDYGCRDDFGSTIEDTSAWAGIHYFAGRGEADEVLTWPEGNGWIARRLAGTLAGRVIPSALAYRVENAGGGVRVDYLDARSGEPRRLMARAALVCLPRFVAARIMPELKKQSNVTARFEYAPWLVANLTIDDPPAGPGAEPAWDNVIYDSDSLGYVSATHQSLSQDRRRGVWTYYLPLPKGDLAENRRALLKTTWEQWVERITADLERCAPGLRERLRNVDIMLWAHGMVRPGVGFIWGAERPAAARPLGNIFFGHSDLSGFSIFEEAQFRGIRAAESALTLLGRRFRSSL